MRDGSVDLSRVTTQINSVHAGDASPSTKRGRDDGMNELHTRALTEHEVAARLGLSVATLRAWRLKRKGPRFVRFGRAVRYLPADLDQFVASSAVGIAADIVGEDAR